MTRDARSSANLARERAVLALWRAERAASRAERFQRLAVEGLEALRELHAKLADDELRTAERHRTSARIQQAHAARLDQFLAGGQISAELPNVAFAVAEVAGVRSAALTLLATDGAVAALVGTDDLAKAAQDLEVVVGDGPARHAATTLQPVTVDGEELWRRWPEYAGPAALLGVHEVTAVPIHLDDAMLGSLSVFDPGYAKEAIDLRPLQTVAEALVSGVLSDLVAGSEAGEQSMAGDRAYVLHHAAGMVAVERGCDVASALAMIRARAFSEGRSATDVALGIVERRAWPECDS
jgi:hypothetical protein